MARGNGRGRGFRGRGEGGGGDRGRGRGGGAGYRGSRGSGRGMPGSSFLPEELDFSIRMFADAPNTNGNVTPRGRGRGGRGGQFSGPNSGAATPNRGRGRGYDSPRGRGRGQPDSYTGRRRSDFGIGSSPRGRGGGPQGRTDTLSGLLYQERPFLRPIAFVPSVFTKVLFQEDEELLKPGVEEVDDTEQSHVPTADQVFRVFSGSNIPRMESDDDDDSREEIEEIDFNDMEKLINPSDTLKTTIVRKSKLVETTTVLEHQFTGFYVDPHPAPVNVEQTPSIEQPYSTDIDVDNLAKMVDETLSAADEDPGPSDVVMSPPPTQTTAPSPAEHSSAAILASFQPEEPISKVQQDLFYIDVQPAPVPLEKAPSQDPPPALRDDEDDDIIVYVAPHPRKADVQDEEPQPRSEEPVAPDTSHFVPYVTPATLPAHPPVASSSSSANVPPTLHQIPDPPSFSSISFSFPQSKTLTGTPSKGSSRLTVPPVSTPRQAKAWKRKRGLTNKKGKAKSSFGAFGAMREEAMLHPRSDPRRNERRKGDSDLDWGDSEDDGGEIDEVEEGLKGLVGLKGKGKARENEVEIMLDVQATRGKGKARDLGDGDDVDDGEHEMDVDPDLAPDMGAMKRFVGGLLGADAGRHATMDDIQIAEIIRREDEDESPEEEDEEEGSSSSADEEEDDVLAAEEAMLISESLVFEAAIQGEDSDDDESEDDAEDQTPRTSFQARLERLRSKARSKKVVDTSLEDMDEGESDEDRDDFINRHMTWADEDEDFIQEIQDMLDENEDILTGRDRKQRNALFRSVRNGAFEDMEDFSPAKRRKDKGKGLPAELQAQWDQDRKKKAERKKERELARLEAAADPLSKKKGGKKGKKAMLAAAKLDSTITVIPNRVIDMVTLVQQIRRFVDDIGGPSSMSLPPTNKETRKNVHEMAQAFHLKSLSKGKGDARYTTLTKTTRSGINVDEHKVAKIMRRSGGMGARGDSFIYDKKGKGAPVVMPRHKEGEVVGKAAPKLNESNLGFRLLAMMGWSEGDRIGFTGGLDAPLTAIIKHTKLGLGATK